MWFNVRDKHIIIIVDDGRIFIIYARRLVNRFHSLCFLSLSLSLRAVHKIVIIPMLGYALQNAKNEHNSQNVSSRV